MGLLPGRQLSLAPGSSFTQTTPGALQRLERRLQQAFPALNVVGAISPPFRDLAAEEDAAIVDRINKSGAQIVWVGLGCPKKKRKLWMQKRIAAR